MVWTFKDKMFVVNTYLNTGKYPVIKGFKGRAHRNKMAYWVKLYQLHGEEALKHRNTTFTAKERLKAVKLVIKGESYLTVAAKLGMPITSVSKWYRIYLTKGFKGLKPKDYEFHKVKTSRDIKKETVEFYLNNRYNIQNLLKERIRDKAEIEYLKKIYALTLSK